MGSVWIAEHRGLETQVAVKFIDDALGVDENILARFSREAAAAAQIRSPHVVQIFDHGTIDGRIPYIVMELLEGESLGNRIARLRQLPLEETAVVLSQTCKALSKVHGLSIVHRDIKPDNIFLIDSDGELFVKVLDFGIAKRRSDAALAMTSSGMAVGTPHYMSPEQLLSSRDVTPATDLWALGAVAFRALTGQVPFDGDTYGAVCAAVSRGVFAPPRALRPDLPEALDEWFARALAIEPSDRFGSARELAERFIDRAGLTTARLTVPSALPKAQVLENSRPPSKGRNGGQAVTDAGASAPELSATQTAPPVTPHRAFRFPSGASIGGASIPSDGVHGSGRRRGALFLAGAVVALGLALAVAFSRRTSGVVPAGMSASGGVTTPTPPSWVAPSSREVSPQGTAETPGPAPPVDPAPDTSSVSEHKDDRDAGGRSSSPSRPTATTVATSRPTAPRLTPSPAPPPSERETDHGF